MIKLVVGLGNPGRQYEFNRHNIGQLAIDQLSFYDDLVWKAKFRGLVSDYEIAGEKVYFLKPQTFMNLSGESLVAAAGFFKIDPTEILVIHDELDLEFGTIRFKKGGGLAGHNGLRSIAQLLGSQDFLRLRLGISRPVHGNESDWVLSDFSSEEEKDLGTCLKMAAEAIEMSLKLGFDAAFAMFSKKGAIPSDKKSGDSHGT